MKAKLIWCLLTTLLLFSCVRDELCYYHPQGARIRMIIRYEAVGLTPDKSFIGIYNAENGAFIRQEQMSQVDRHELFLGIGKYNLVVYNEPIIEGEYTTAHSVGFGDMNRWETFKTFAADDPLLPQGTIKTSERNVLNIEDQLSVGRITEFEVTHAMMHKFHLDPIKKEEVYKEIVIDTVLYFHPRRVFTKVNLEMQVIHYPGWILKRNNGSRPRFTGASDAYYMGTNRYSPLSTTQYMSIYNGITTYNGENPTTNFQGSFYIVGLPDDQLPSLLNRYPFSLFFRFEHGSATSPTGIEIRPVTVDLVSSEGAELTAMHLTRAGDVRPADSKVYLNDVLDVYVLLKLPQRVPIGDNTDVDIEDWNQQDVPLDSPSNLYFHPNGGIGQLFRWRYPAGRLLFMPTPSSFIPPSGCSFQEWNTLSDGTGKPYPVMAPYTMPKEGGTLYAIWKK